MSARYVVLPKAHRDLGDAADYLINEAGNLAKGPPTVPALDSAIAHAQPSCWQLTSAPVAVPDPASDPVRSLTGSDLGPSPARIVSRPSGLGGIVNLGHSLAF